MSPKQSPPATKEFSEALGKALRDLREARNMTQVRLGEILGEWPANVNNWEHGRWTPSLWYIQNILNALGASWEDLGAALDWHLPPSARTLRKKQMSPALREYFHTYFTGQKAKQRTRPRRARIAQPTKLSDADRAKLYYAIQNERPRPTYRKLAERFGVSRTTVMNELRKANLA